MSVMSPGAPRGRGLAFVFLFIAFLLPPLFADDQPNADNGAQTPTQAAPDKEKKDDQTTADNKKNDDQADVVVTATRLPADRLQVPPFVVNVTQPAIVASGQDSLPAVAAQSAGVQLFDYGYPGGLEQLFLRGATGTRVLVLLDGVPTNNALDGQMSLSLIPLEMVDRLEIVEGGMSLLYGSQAVGGVINVITKKGADLDSFFTASLTDTSYLPQEYSSGGTPPQAASLFDGQRASLSLGHNFGACSFFASGIFDYARNQYYYDNSGVTNQRDNSGLISGSGVASLSFPWSSGAVNLTGLYSRQLAGVPGSLSFPSPNAQETDERFQALASYHEDKFFTDALATDLKLSFTSQYRLYDDPAFPPADDSNLSSFFAELSQKAALADWLSLQYGGDTQVDAVTGTSSGDHIRDSGSLFLAAPLNFGGLFRIFPAARLDLSSDYGSELSYGLGASWLLSKEASLKLSLANSFRAPTLNELYNAYGSNPNLQPERGWHADLGFSLETKPVKIESAVFVRYMEEEINYYPPLYLPENTDHSFYPGAEAQAEVELLDHFFAEAAYTFIYSFNLSGGLTLADDRRMPHVPMHEGHVYLSYKSETLILRLGVDALGDRYDDANNTTYLPWAFILNANVRWQAAPWIAVKAALDNLLNTQYQLVYDYPMPGISLRWGVEIKL